MFKNVLKTWFDVIWWLGFLIAIGAAIFLFMDKPFKSYITHHKEITLIYGVSHMIILTLFGLLAIRNKANNIDVGHRISTMGYLHTLIGTSVALILVSGSGSEESKDILNQMNLIIVPIGSALITSIIGWAVGTEMERSIHGTYENTIVDDALGNLAKDIDHIGEKLELSTNAWSANIDNTVQVLSDSGKDLESKFEQALMSSSKTIENNSESIMNKYLASFDQLFQKVEKQVDTIQDQFKNSSTDASYVMQNLLLGFETLFKQMNKHTLEIEKNFNTSSDSATKIMDELLQGFKIIFEKMNTHALEIEKNFNTSSDSANKVMEDLSLSYQKLLTQTSNNINRVESNLNKSGANADEAITRFITSFEKLFNTMETYSGTMQTHFETSVNDAKKTMDNLASSFKKVFTQINTVSTQWEDHIKNMQNFANDSSINLNDLLQNSKKIANEIKDVANGMPNSAQILREVDDILEVLRVIKEREI